MIRSPLSTLARTLLAVFVVLGHRPSAWAQPRANAQPIAEELFEQARSALEAGRYDEACDKLAASYRVEPATGTLLNLAVCHELEGKLATAWSEYSAVIALARKEGEPSRAELAEERVRVVRPKLSYLTLVPSAAARLSGLVVSLDGVPIDAGAWGSALPVDPGAHEVRASAPGRLAFRSSVQVGAEADRRTIEIPALEPLPPAPSPAPAPRPSQQPAEPGMPLVRKLGFGALGVAVLAAGAGAYFGLRARSSWEERNEHCPGGRCDEQAVAAWEEARRAATVSDAAFALSVVAGGASAYLLLVPVSPDESREARRPFGVTSLSVGVGGPF